LRKLTRENYFDLIQDKLHKAGAARVDLVFKADGTREKPDMSPYPPYPPAPRQLALPNISKNGRVRLNHDFTFDRFVVGQCNEFAYSASRALAHGSPLDYNCLLMLANTGLGKSHLTHAIAHTILKEKPSTRLYYMTAEDFTNEMIASLKNNRIEAFKDKYRRGCDVLLLEEMPFFGGPATTRVSS